MRMNEINKEWIITNNNGSYSASTVSFANTRTYHGIFVKSFLPYYRRFVCLSKLFEEIIYNGNIYLLDTNYYPGTIYPKGYELIESYEIFPIPEFEYVLADLRIKKRILIHPDLDCVLVRYIFSKDNYQLKLYPLLSFRTHHNVIRKSMRDFKIIIEKLVEFEEQDVKLYINSPGQFIEKQDWYYNFQYPVEIERGTNSEEDLFSPGYFAVSNQREFIVQISSEPLDVINYDELEKEYLNRLKFNLQAPDFMKNMLMASNLLLVKDNILAGYYWFEAWSRDAFISLPGLLLVNKKFTHAKNLLMNYVRMMNNGIIPKKFSNDEDNVSADSSLWFIYALYKYYEYTKDKNFLNSIYKYCLKIIDAYIKGNEFFDLDGVFVRTKKAPLTWMDAKLGDNVFTPRIGKPVEINALWYNALSSVDYFSHELRKRLNPKYIKIKEEIEDYFSSIFMNDNIILDVADPDDPSIRPNFILCFSLPFPVLSNFKDFKNIVDEHLLTPYGLRSLSYKDPNFKPKYLGNWFSRDSAYHNGSVWPWLAGFYITASVKSGSDAKEIFNYFKPLYSMTYLPEIFDGLEPSTPKGCIIQAWSYAELIRAYYEDVLPNLKE